jgi:hypothetical protein
MTQYSLITNLVKTLALLSVLINIPPTKLLAEAISLPGYNYYCFTRKHKIQIRASYPNTLSYNSFNDITNYSFEQVPDMTLENGRYYYQTKNKLKMTWNNGSYIYQVTILGPSDIEGIGKPSSGNIDVKYRGKIISKEKCDRISSGEPY